MSAEAVSESQMGPYLDSVKKSYRAGRPMTHVTALDPEGNRARFQAHEGEVHGSDNHLRLLSTLRNKGYTEVASHTEPVPGEVETQSASLAQAISGMASSWLKANKG